MFFVCCDQTVETNPTVQVWTNGIQASCAYDASSNVAASPNCYFNYLSSRTPNVTAVNASFTQPVVANDVVTVLGAGFSSDVTANTVQFASVNEYDNASYTSDAQTCTVVFSNWTMLQFVVPNLPAGAYYWSLIVDGGGLASVFNPFSTVGAIAIAVAVQSVSPSFANACGGDVMTLTGTGYPLEANNLQVCKRTWTTCRRCQ